MNDVTGTSQLSILPCVLYLAFWQGVPVFSIAEDDGIEFGQVKVH